MINRRIFLQSFTFLGLDVSTFSILHNSNITPPNSTAKESLKYNVLVEKDLKIKMRDGIQLSCDIYKPVRNNKFVGSYPVILERTPYSKATPSATEKSIQNLDPLSREVVAEFFVRNGYIVIYQDCRGRYESDGYFKKYLGEAPDGFDSCQWILEQSWCNGKIATMGFSYAAHTQAALASMGAPGIATMFIDSGGFANAYQGGIKQGGAYELKQVTWAYRNSLRSPEVQNNEQLFKAMQKIDLKDWFTKMPWKPKESPLSLLPEYEDFVFEQWTKGNFDDYWKEEGLYAEGYYQNFPDVPIFLMSSWYDPYPRSAVSNFKNLTKLKDSPIFLVLGPWTHGARSLTYAGEVDFGDKSTLDKNLALDYWDIRLKWFDCWLKGKKNIFYSGPKVSIFLMGGGSGKKNKSGRLEHGGHWIKSDGFPLKGTTPTTYYLHQEKLLSLDAPVSEDFKISYYYDPKNPVPTIGGNITSGRPIMEGGAYDQVESEAYFGSKPPYLPLSTRDDVLVFRTKPLEQDLKIVGAIVANLWISSDCPDTDFTIKLIDEYPPNQDYPDGFAMNIVDGILRVRYRNSWEQPELMEKDRIYPVEVETFPTANLFKKGHTLRIDISSSNFPHFDLNFNTGEPEGKASYHNIAFNTVFANQNYPSKIILPIVP